MIPAQNESARSKYRTNPITSSSYMSDISYERRRFSRVPFKTKAEIRVNKALWYAKEVDNLSVGGCLLPIAADLEPQTLCQVSILLSGRTSELNVKIDGKVVRCEQGAVAIKFTHIDPESLFHLQNIVRYNSEDPGSIEQEILNYPILV